MQIVAPPVKELARRLNVPVVQPERIKTNEAFRAELERLAPRAIVVVGYGRMIPQWMIDLPPLGNINLHASLLPKYRGAAPVQWAIAMGETVTGVTTMRINSGLDTGDILLQREGTILPEDTALTLAPRLAAVGAQLMVATLDRLEQGSVAPRPQDDSRATLAPILQKEDGIIDFLRSATEIWNRLRGFQPWPGAFTTFRGKKLNIWEARPAQPGSLAPGQMQVPGELLLVGCGQGTALELIVVQPEGKKRMLARDFVHGYHPASGERFGH